MSILYKFFNRLQEVNALLSAEGRTLQNLHGEGGIGKSRLLQEVRQQLEAAGGLVLLLDLSKLDESPGRVRAILQSITQTLPGWSVFGKDYEGIAEDLASRLIELSMQQKVYLIFDTIEAWQDDGEFWNWLENHLISRLTVNGNVRLIFSGRLPTAFHSYEVRRVTTSPRISRLEPESEGYLQAIHVIEQNDLALLQDARDQLAQIVLRFSVGHPRLTELLAEYVANNADLTEEQFEKRLSSEIVTPYIEDDLLKLLEPGDRWRALIWWISVLPQFDSTILSHYLRKVFPDLENEMDYFYVQGLSRLRLYDFIEFRAKQGYRLYPVVGEILRRCFAVAQPENYALARRAASQTYQELAKEFDEEDDDCKEMLALASQFEMEENL